MKKQGVLIYDAETDRMDIRFGLLDYYGGLHCGDEFDLKIDDEYAKNKIASQMDIEIKKQKANYIIDNSHDLCYTYKQIEDILQRIKKEE